MMDNSYFMFGLPFFIAIFFGAQIVSILIAIPIISKNRHNKSRRKLEIYTALEMFSVVGTAMVVLGIIYASGPGSIVLIGAPVLLPIFGLPVTLFFMPISVIMNYVYASIYKPITHYFVKYGPVVFSLIFSITVAILLRVSNFLNISNEIDLYIDRLYALSSQGIENVDMGLLIIVISIVLIMVPLIRSIIFAFQYYIAGHNFFASTNPAHQVLYPKSIEPARESIYLAVIFALPITFFLRIILLPFTFFANSIDMYLIMSIGGAFFTYYLSFAISFGVVKTFSLPKLIKN